MHQANDRYDHIGWSAINRTIKVDYFLFTTLKGIKFFISNDSATVWTFYMIL